jgi:hypothetical protein
MAPEVFKKDYTIKSDLFSIGIILYELYYGNAELNLTQEEILNNIRNGITIKNEYEDINEFNKLKNLIEECTKNEENRIDWDKYFNHSFYNSEIEIIIKIDEDDLNNNIKLISEEFKYFNKDNTELYIDNIKEEVFKNKYKFNKIGNHLIKFIFNNNIELLSLEKMFYKCENITYINFLFFNALKFENINNMFSYIN